jgi:hypothetical protein
MIFLVLTQQERQDEFQKKLDENKAKADEKTAKKRSKRYSCVLLLTFSVKHADCFTILLLITFLLTFVFDTGKEKSRRKNLPRKVNKMRKQKVTLTSIFLIKLMDN